jgi:hypothetical protein
LLWDVVVALLGPVGLFFLAARLWNTNQGLAVTAIAFGVVSAAVSSFRAFNHQHHKNHRRSDHWMDPFLHHLRDCLRKVGAQKPGHKLRVCLHVKRGNEWVQLTEYAEDDSTW